MEPQFVLIKYMQEQQYLDEFISGSLYMNSLYNFWVDSRLNSAQKTKDEYLAEHPDADPDRVYVYTGERPELQEDTLEGVTGYATKDPHFDKVMGQYRLSDFLLRPLGMKYCNVLCFYTLSYEFKPSLMPGFQNVSFTTNDKMLELGKYIAIITDMSRFIDRVSKAAREKSYVYAAGPVHYHDLKHDGRSSGVYKNHHLMLKTDDPIDIESVPGLKLNRDCFNKNTLYEFQKEWRIALNRGVKDTSACRLEVGDLSDIVVASDSKNFERDIRHVIGENRIHSVNGYFGDREKLRNGLTVLGDNKVDSIVFIG